ncbi:MAG: PQQ-binding-like beta-propeller repeat protein, partial [Victivallaceae bacterium]
NFYALAEAHRLTGDAKYRDAMVKSLERLEPIADNHYGMGLVVLGYDYWARSGLIPAELVRKADRIFLQYLICEAGSWWRRNEDHAVFADNRHHVYGTWGYLQTAKMLWRGLDSRQRDSETGRFIARKIEEGDRWFAACRREYRPTVLSTGVFINLNIFLLHAVQNRAAGVAVPPEQLEELARLSAAAMDNTGGAIGISGYEDTYPGFWRQSYPVGGVLNLAAHLADSPAMRRLRQDLKGVDNQTWWQLSSDNHAWQDGGAIAAKNADYLGFQMVSPRRNAPLYVSYRNGFSPDDLFFCLTGSGTADIGTGDSGKGDQTYPGMLARLSWNSLPFFVQNTNSTTPLNRNTLTLDRTGKAEKVHADLRCESPGKINGVDYLTMFADRYCGADWRRRIIVKDNDFMLFSDTVTAPEKDCFNGILTWRTPYAARRTADGAEIGFNGRLLQMAWAANVPLESRIFRSDATPGAALRPDLIRQYFSSHLEKGESMTVGTLLYPGKEHYQFRMLAPDVFLLRQSTTGALALAGFGKFSTPMLNLDAPAFYLPEDAQGYPAGTLPRELQRLWNAAVPVRVPPRSAVPATDVWRYAGFSPGRLDLRNFVINSPNIPDIEKLCTGNLDRATCHRGKAPLELTVEFPGETYMSEAIMLFAQDNGRGKWYLNPPSASPKVELAIDGQSRPFSNQPSLELDESYKGNTYSYTGTVVPVAASGKKFTFKIDAGQLYQVRFLGAQCPAEALDALAFGKDKLLLRSDRNEIVCLRARDGVELWRRQLPCGIRSWAVTTGLIGLACADSTIKALDPQNGETVWSCDTSSIAMGLPYSIAAYGEGFIASSYYHLTVIGADGGIRNPDQRILPGMWIYDVMGKTDLNADGFPDAIGRALWGHVSLFDGKTGKVDYFANIKGQLKDWRLLKSTDGNPELLIVSYDGIGLYHATIRPELLHDGWDHAPDEDALLLEPRSQRQIWAHRFQSGINAFTE